VLLCTQRCHHKTETGGPVYNVLNQPNIVDLWLPFRCRHGNSASKPGRLVQPWATRKGMELGAIHKGRALQQRADTGIRCDQTNSLGFLESKLLLQLQIKNTPACSEEMAEYMSRSFLLSICIRGCMSSKTVFIHSQGFCT
jgi:hypothetical protein